MQNAFRKLTNRLVRYRHNIPAPIYGGLRKIYLSIVSLPHTRVPAEFDTAFYLRTITHSDLRGLRPYVHFVRYGQKKLHNPSSDFDIVWYLHTYGHTFDQKKIDPFSHYLKIGRNEGNVPHPPRHVTFNKDASRPVTSQPSRACLFAGYDPDQRIDDCVVIYLKELARHADVFYLADCEMPARELAKLDGIVKKAWASRHGSYDFGSYQRLAQKLVGWKTLSTYDEVIFANDSCYLVKPLDNVFTHMSSKPCAWWGLQATKGLFSTIEAQPFPGTQNSIDINIVKFKHLDQFERDPVYDFHLGSYFLVFRRDVINDLCFQRVINSVQPEETKINIIKKYEVGLTRFLIGLGYEFETFGSVLTKRHPVYTEVVFDLIEKGFPLFKRLLLVENHYNISSLAYWKVALGKINSITSAAQIEENYSRTSNANKIYRSFHVLEDGVPALLPMENTEFIQHDATTPKYGHYWGFPVSSSDQILSDASMAVLDSVKEDERIVKVIFTREKSFNLKGQSVIIVPIASREGQTYLVRCQNLFVEHGQEDDLIWTINDKSRTIHSELNPKQIQVVRNKSTLNRHWQDVSHSKIRNSVVFLKTEHLDYAYQERISILTSQLRDEGWDSQAIDLNSVSIGLLAKVEFVIFCALEMSPQTLDLAEGIRAAGGKIIYDTDALVHDESAFFTSGHFRRNPKSANRLRLLGRHRAQLMMLADGFTVTTPALLSSVMAFKKPAAIVDHCMLPSLVQEYRTLQKKRPDDQIHLSYVTGLGVHAGDFIECKTAVFDLMRERSNIVLHVIGTIEGSAVDVPKELGGRILRHGIMSQSAIHALLHMMDINLVPLSDTPFNDALSAARVGDAALHALPTIASPCESYRNLISHRRTGYFARTQQEWQSVLREAVDNLNVCRNIGQAAQRSIVPNFTTEVAVKQLTMFLTNNW